MSLPWEPVARRKPRHVPFWIFGIKSKLNERHKINTIVNKIKSVLKYFSVLDILRQSINQFLT